MANGTLKVSNIQTSSGSGTITLGQSGETLALGSGVTSKFNQPAFEAHITSNQTIDDNTITKAQFDTKDFDTNNAYDNSTNYRFTPQVAGKYFIYAQLELACTSNQIEYVQFFIYKNGSIVRKFIEDPNDDTEKILPLYNSMVLDLNGSTDYVEIFGRIARGSGTCHFTGNASERPSFFGAYRLGA